MQHHDHDPDHDHDRGGPERAVDNATSDHLLDGSLRDAHGEVSPDPELDGSGNGEPDPRVTAAHRHQADAVEEGDRQATGGALGETDTDGPSGEAAGR